MELGQGWKEKNYDPQKCQAHGASCSINRKILLPASQGYEF